VLAGVALLVLAWLALSLRAFHQEAEGREVLDHAQLGHIGDAEVSRGLDALRRARSFNADAEPLLAEVQLLVAAGRDREAAAVAKRLVAQEPDDLEGWIALSLAATVTHDRALRARALREVKRLNPQLGERLIEGQRRRGS
jgi:hypothetical protein